MLNIDNFLFSYFQGRAFTCCWWHWGSVSGEVMKTAESRQGCRHENGWDNQKGESSDGVTQHSWSGRGHQLDAARHDGRQVGVEATRTSGTEAVAENCHRIKVETRNTGEPVEIKR